MLAVEGAVALRALLGCRSPADRTVAVDVLAELADVLGAGVVAPLSACADGAAAKAMPMPAATAPARNHETTGRTRVRPRAFAEREVIRVDDMETSSSTWDRQPSLADR